MRDFNARCALEEGKRTSTISSSLLYAGYDPNGSVPPCTSTKMCCLTIGIKAIGISNHGLKLQGMEEWPKW
jgi:hypothetical protein